MAINPITYKGVTYRSLNALYENYKPNISYAAFARNVRAGMTIDKALRPGKGTRAKSISYKGKTYAHAQILCDAYGISLGTYRARLKYGWSIGDALGDTKHSSQREIRYKDIVYVDKSALCKAFGITLNMFRKRLRLGWTMDETLNVKARKYEFKDECAGIVYKITNRINNKIYIGITTTSLKERFRIHIYNAFTDNSKTKLAAAMREFGKENFEISAIVHVTSRTQLLEVESDFINKLDTVQNGYNTLAKGNFGAKGKNITYRNIRYRSLRALADDYDVAYRRLTHKITMGISIKKALSDLGGQRLVF